jgi:hypothetical protein
MIGLSLSGIVLTPVFYSVVRCCSERGQPFANLEERS